MRLRSPAPRSLLAAAIVGLCPLALGCSSDDESKTDAAVAPTDAAGVDAGSADVASSSMDAGKDAPDATLSLDTGPEASVDAATGSAFSASWSLEYVGGGSVSCAAAGTPTVVLQAIETVSKRLSRVRFPCDAGQGVGDVLPAGTYDLTLMLLDPGGVAVSQITDRGYTISADRLTTLTPIVFVIQSWRVEWTLSKGSPPGPSPTSCAAVGARTVQLITQLGAGPPVSFSWKCEDGMGVSTAIPLGGYTAEVKLLDGSEQVLSATGVRQIQIDEQRRAELAVTFELR